MLTIVSCVVFTICIILLADESIGWSDFSLLYYPRALCALNYYSSFYILDPELDLKSIKCESTDDEMNNKQKGNNTIILILLLVTNSRVYALYRKHHHAYPLSSYSIDLAFFFVFRLIIRQRRRRVETTWSLSLMDNASGRRPDTKKKLVVVGDGTRRILLRILFL